MLTGLCWPTPGVHERLDESVLVRIAGLGVDLLRVNVDWAHPDPVGWLNHILATTAAAGHTVTPLPILDYGQPEPTATPAQFASLCTAVAGGCLWLEDMELGNEPLVLAGISPQRYADFVRAGARAIRAVRPDVRIGIQAEVMDCLSGKYRLVKSKWRHGPFWRRRRYHDEVRHLVPAELYDAACIHPYREAPSEASGYGTREIEWAAYRQACGYVPLWVTEVGWRLDHGVFSPEQVGDFVRDELRICEEAGVEMCIVYAYGADPGYDFGVFDRDWNRRPAAEAIAAYCAARRIA